MKYDGCVVVCGLVGGMDLLLSVYFFILCNVMFVGVDLVMVL